MNDPVDIVGTQPLLLPGTEAAQLLRIRRSLAYQLAHRDEAAGRLEVLPSSGSDPACGCRVAS
jgi:hypothetical protein